MTTTSYPPAPVSWVNSCLLRCGGAPHATTAACMEQEAGQ